MSEPNKPYDIDPAATSPPQDSPEAPKARPIDFPPAAPVKPAEPVQPKGKIEAPELLAGFDENADFDKDPEVDRVILGRPVEPVKPLAAVPEEPVEEFVQEGLGGAKVWAIVGGILLITAMIAAGLQPSTSTAQRLLRVLLVMYNTLLHTGTGVVAVFVAATLLSKKVGSFELAGARMLAAVGAFALLVSIRLKLFGWPPGDHIVVLILASAAYLLLVATTFNLWKRNPLGYVVLSHFFLWLIVAVGMLLSQVATAPTESKPAEVRPVTPQVTPAKPALNPSLPAGTGSDSK